MSSQKCRFFPFLQWHLDTFSQSFGPKTFTGASQVHSYQSKSGKKCSTVGRHFYELSKVPIFAFFSGGTQTFFLNPLVQNFYRGLHKDTHINPNQRKSAPLSGGTFMSSQKCQFSSLLVVELGHFFLILWPKTFTGGFTRTLISIHIRK